MSAENKTLLTDEKIKECFHEAYYQLVSTASTFYSVGPDIVRNNGLRNNFAYAIEKAVLATQGTIANDALGEINTRLIKMADWIGGKVKVAQNSPEEAPDFCSVEDYELAEFTDSLRAIAGELSQDKS